MGDQRFDPVQIDEPRDLGVLRSLAFASLFTTWGFLAGIAVEERQRRLDGETRRPEVVQPGTLDVILKPAHVEQTWNGTARGGHNGEGYVKIGCPCDGCKTSGTTICGAGSWQSGASETAPGAGK